MKKLLNPPQGSLLGINLFCICIYSIFITFFFLHEASKFISFDLKDLSKVYYSEGTSFGVDIGSRVKWMYRLLAGSAIIFSITLFFLKRIFKNTPNSLLKHEDLLVFSFAGIVLCITRIFGADSTQVLSSLFFLFSFKLILIILQARGVRISKYLLQAGIFNLSISFAFLVLFAFVFVFGTSDLIHKNHSTILFFSTVLFLIYYTVCFHQFKLGARKATWFLLPLVGIPYIAFLSVESFFYRKLTHGQISDHHQTFILLFIIFTLLTCAMLFVWRKQRTSSLKQFKQFIIPSLLFCYVIITAYEPVIENVADMFEPGNIMNSHMRVFEFGQIPVLDFMSSHMLSEQWYGYVYGFIFGFNNDLSSLTYGFLNSIIFVYVLYQLLLRLFKRESYALAFIFLFPFVTETFNYNVLIAILPFFLVKDLFEKPSAKQVFKILLTCSLLMIWRIDTGVVAIFGTVIFLPILFFVYPEKISFKIIFKGGLYFAGLGLVVTGITFLIRGPQKIFNSMQLFYHYVSGSQSHGHQHIFGSDVHQFYLFHILYPVLAVAMCLGIIYLLRTKFKAIIFGEAYILTAALFIFILYIVHLQRGLVRHGFAELNDDTIISMFYVATALFITFFFKERLPVQRYGVFYGSTFLLFVALKYFPFNVSKIPLENGITGKRFYNMEKPFEDSLLVGRIITDPSFAKDNYSDLKQFMDTYLQKEQTFMDFSNTSMLYYYCNRSIPGYFNQNLENTIDDLLHFELLKQLDTKKVPMVIFSSYPHNVNDAMDNIPNVMRHYILAEHIFTYYKPFGVIDHKNVWLTPALQRSIKDSLPQDPNTYKPQHYDYKLIAEYLGYYYTKKNSTDLSQVFTIDAKQFSANDHTYSFKLPPIVRKAPHCFLSIEFKQKDHEIKPYPLTVDLLNDSSQVLGSFSFERRDKVSNTYMLRLSNHYLWHINTISHIRLTKDEEITSVQLLNDIRPEYKNANSN